MLYYLDAGLSIAPGTRRGEFRSGLNENYARELLELHTLGVDGGYTQADVVAVARAFTGWTIDHPRPGHRARAAASCFDARAHDRGPETISARTSPPTAAARRASACWTSWRGTRPPRASS